MLQAYILIQTEVGIATRVATEFAAVDGVTSASAVNGPYDIIAITQAASVDELGRFVSDKVRTIEGITGTLTCPVVWAVMTR